MWVDNIIRFGALLFLSSNLVETGPVTEDLGKLVSERIQNANLYLINSGLELDGQLGQLQANDANQVQRISNKQMRQLRLIRQRILEANWRLLRQRVLNEADLDETYKPLLTSLDKETLPEFLWNLSKPFKRCDSDLIDFLVPISSYGEEESEATARNAASNDQHLLVQNYSKLRVELCWQRFLDSIPYTIDSQLSNMSVPLFKSIEQVAINMKLHPMSTNIRTRLNIPPKRHTTGSIESIVDEGKSVEETDNKTDLNNLFDPNCKMTSLDSSDSNKLMETIGVLERVALGSLEECQEFALGIIRLYKMHVEYVANDSDGDGLTYSKLMSKKKEILEFYKNFIGRPCNELLKRMYSIFGGAKIFKGHVDQTLGDYLAREKQGNMRLSYELQMYRICKRSSAVSERNLIFLLGLDWIWQNGVPQID